MIAAYRNLALPLRFGFQLKAPKKRAAPKNQEGCDCSAIVPFERSGEWRASTARRYAAVTSSQSRLAVSEKKPSQANCAWVFKASLRASPSTNGAISDIEFNTPIVSICEF